jgi:hypothetical protein
LALPREAGRGRPPAPGLPPRDGDPIRLEVDDHVSDLAYGGPVPAGQPPRATACLTVE